ncbi:MAG: hypothetical protein HYU59_01430 [Magnetospirillum gryphiswaldense]|nr:hypothetical protein [Magnetospirillum gryphiswaldense]
MFGADQFGEGAPGLLRCVAAVFAEQGVGQPQLRQHVFVSFDRVVLMVQGGVSVVGSQVLRQSQQGLRLGRVGAVPGQNMFQVLAQLRLGNADNVHRGGTGMRNT